MLDVNQIDINEDSILQFDEELLKILLSDRSSNNNIIWATDNYADLGPEFSPSSHITIESITGEHSTIIQPRIKKSREVQTLRSKDKAEVFTPSDRKISIQRRGKLARLRQGKAYGNHLRRSSLYHQSLRHYHRRND